ncbi:MAG: bifunctional phosphopantothenoylcysteine decarboxylase/phosphopantothenate--cysteine ligase CoaBC [Chloroflexota bacterium]|nr:bifunctional phosphopantothenoylcysteine decarboxylase/phosphopantothenate--cysteine ligase CoaBC [Chloroflexota bacterium]
MMDVFKNKKIALCVCGSISAYKSVDLASKWVQQGADVKVLMTKSAQKFIGKATFEGITHNKVIDDLWNNESDLNIDHLDIAKNSDLIIVSPITANMISKLAQGISDDIISTTLLATEKPLIIAPAMDGNMYDHFGVKNNIEILKKNGVIILEPESGYLASGLIGKGRLRNLEEINNEVKRVLTLTDDFKGKNILISAGGTREPIDAVRFIGNRSSGKMGHSLAEICLQRGANVTLVTTSGLSVPMGIKKISVSTAEEMKNEIIRRIDSVDCIIMAAAVADFKPEITNEGKLKKDDIEKLKLNLVKNDDILNLIKDSKCIKIGFAAETNNHDEYGMKKLNSKCLDMIVINDVSNNQIGFESEYNQVKIITKKGDIFKTDIENKKIIASNILDKLKTLIK